MPSKLMVLCKYNGNSFVTVASENGLFKDFIEVVKSRYPDIPATASITYALPGCTNCELSCEVDYQNMFAILAVHNLKYVEVSLRTSSSLTSEGPSFTPSLCVSESCASSSFGTTSLSYGEDCISNTAPVLMTAAWENCISGVNQVFPGGAPQFRNELQKYALRTGYSYNIPRNDKTRIRAECTHKENGCKWMIYVVVDKSKKRMYVKEYVPKHECGVGAISRNNKYMSSSLVAEVVVEKMKLNPHYRPVDAERDIPAQYAIDISYNNAYRGVEKAREAIYGEYRLSYHQLLKYVELARETNPGSHIIFESDSETKMFQRLFISFYACFEGFKFCRPILYVDATFLTGRYKCQLLCCTAKDGDNRKFLNL